MAKSQRRVVMDTLSSSDMWQGSELCSSRPSPVFCGSCEEEERCMLEGGGVLSVVRMSVEC